ncbi:hypothetical protein DFH06DRAFT_661425 [Mycena polygramma]|nr:hypothetical protein DFH06DRAFT_661425 [Mycena polygramma]
MRPFFPQPTHMQLERSRPALPHIYERLPSMSFHHARHRSCRLPPPPRYLGVSPHRPLSRLSTGPALSVSQMALSGLALNVYPRPRALRVHAGAIPPWRSGSSPTAIQRHAQSPTPTSSIAPALCRMSRLVRPPTHTRTRSVFRGPFAPSPTILPPYSFRRSSCPPTPSALGLVQSA